MVDEEPKLVGALDATTLDRLVRLRALHERAVVATSDPTRAGQHEAIILLDGAVEQALLVAAAELGITLSERDSLVAIHGKVCSELGTRWTRPGSKTIVELHRSRNNVQHHGVLPREDHLPIWVAETDRYIRSLVRAVFGSDIDGLHIASAITTTSLRDTLVAAEVALRAEDTRTVVSLCERAFAAALDHFRGVPRAIPPSLDSFEEFRSIAGALERVGEFISTSYFAPAPSDGKWFAALTSHRWTAESPPELTDARRAFGFVVAWVQRWEAFEARKPRITVPDVPEPDPDVDYACPELLTIIPANGSQLFGPIFVLDVQLTPVPPGWSSHISRAETALLRSKEIDGLKRITPLSGSGLRIVIADTMTPSEARTLVERAVVSVHRSFEAELEQRRAHREQLHANVEATRSALKDENEVTAVEPTNHDWRSPASGQVVITFGEPVWDQANSALVASALRRRTTTEGHTNAVFGLGQLPQTLHVDPRSFPVQHLPSWLRDAVDEVRKAAEQAAREAADRQQHVENFVAEMNHG